jgi:hypothetical protein
MKKKKCIYTYILKYMRIKNKGINESIKEKQKKKKKKKRKK